MRGYGFSKYVPKQLPNGGFDELLKLFLELLNYSAGDANEALAWMNELDKEYQLSEISEKSDIIRSITGLHQGKYHLYYPEEPLIESAHKLKPHIRELFGLL